MPCVLITGTSSGIGEASVRRFAEEGWSVMATVRPERRRQDFSWPDGVRTFELQLDDPDSVSLLVHSFLEEFGPPDVIVNNAGYIEFGPIEDVLAPVIERQFRVNVFQPLDLTLGFVPAMRKRGSGTVVFISSLGGLMTFPFYGVYNASKHALESFAEGLWHELKPFGIRVKTIEFGYVETSIFDAVLGADVVERASEPYRPWVRNIVDFTRRIRRHTSREEAAREVFRVATEAGDHLRHPAAAYAVPMLRLRRWLGDQFQMRVVNRDWMGFKG